MLYFAYGSNMDDLQMRDRCPDSALVGIAVLKGYRVGFTYYSERRNGGVADIIPDTESSVWGLVYKMVVTDLDTLDSLEGKGTAYDRMTVPVHFLDGRTIEAEVYYVINKKQHVEPTEEYLGLLRKAARKHRFPETYIEQYDYRGQVAGDNS